MLHSFLTTIEFTIIPVTVPFLLLLSKMKKRSRTPVSHLYDEFAFELLATDSTLIIAFYVRIYGDSDRYIGAVDLMASTLLLAIIYTVSSLIRALFSQNQKVSSVAHANSGISSINIWTWSFFARVLFAHGAFALYLIFVTLFLYKH